MLVQRMVELMVEELCGGIVAGSPMRISESFGKTSHNVSHSRSISAISFCRLACKEDLLKYLAILSDTTMRRTALDGEDLKPYWKSEKKATFPQVIKNAIIHKFLKGFTNHRKKTSREVVFSSRPFPNNFKYGDH